MEGSQLVVFHILSTGTQIINAFPKGAPDFIMNHMCGNISQNLCKKRRGPERKFSLINIS